MHRALLGYFPAALFEVAEHSRESNDKHNPGEEIHWARGKSADHADCIVRHLIDAGLPGREGRKYHLRALAWRALAMLQEECEAEGAEPGFSSRFPTTEERIQAALRDRLHPAQQLAVEAFKAEQALPPVELTAGGPELAELHVGADNGVKSIRYEIVDTRPGILGFQIFEDQTFASPTEARLRIEDSIDEEFLSDFEIRKVTP